MFTSVSVLEVLALLVTFAIHSTLLLAGAWLLSRSLSAPRLRELVWKGALVGALATTALQTQVARGPMAISFSSAASATPAPVAATEDSGRAQVLGLMLPAGVDAASLSDTDLARTDSIAGEAPSSGSTAAAIASKPWSASQVLLLTWLLAVGLGLLNFLCQRTKLRRALSDMARVKRGPMVAKLKSLAPKVELWSSIRISSPLVLGRRGICVPSYALGELDETSQTAMLAHEVEHLLRRDGAWLLFAVALQIAFPFQPLIRLAIRHLRQDAELLCDEGALRETGDGLALARCLATVAARYTRPALPTWSAAMAATPSELIRRVERALAEPTAPPRRRIFATATLGIAALAVLACAGPRAKTAETPSSPEVDQARVQQALLNLADPASELILVLQVNEPGTQYHTGLNGGEPTIPWGPNHKGPSVWVGRQTECVAAGVPFESDTHGQDSLAAFLGQAMSQNPERKVTIQPEQGVVYADVVSLLDQVIAAGFVDIGFVGSYGDGLGNSASSSNRIAVRPEAARADAGSRAAAALGRLRDLDANESGSGELRFQSGLDESEAGALRSLGYVADSDGEEIATKLEALGYAAAPEEGLDDPTIQELAALGYLEAPEDDTDTGPGEFAGYMEIDGKLEPFYEEIGEPDFNSDPPLPDPAFTIHIDNRGTISVDGKVLVAADSTDLKPLRAELVKRAKALKHKPVAEGSNFMIADESVLISMARTTPFRRALFVYQQFGRRDIAIVKAQFNFGSTAKEPGQVFSVPLPLDADGAVEEGQEPAPKINLYASTSGIKLVTPDGAVLQRTHQEIRSGESQDLSDALVTAAKKWPSAPVVLSARGEVQADPLAGLLTFARHEGIASRIQFSGYFPE